MKTTYEQVFVAAVAAKIAKSKELGISASWSTANHLDALAACISKHVDDVPQGTDMTPLVRDILGECYNVSAFQQMLAKKFEKLPGGHFQRETKKSIAEQADDVFAALARETTQG